MKRFDIGRKLRSATTIRLLFGLALIAPAVLLGARGEEGPAASMVSELAGGDAMTEQEYARLDALFARHYDIPLDLAQSIHEAARAASVNPVVAFGLVRTESSFRREVVSYAGAVGYTQLMPSTARWMEDGLTRRDLFHADTNLRVGFEYLRYLLDYYDGDLRLALTAYNRGPGTVDRLMERGRDPENGYADKVLGTPPSQRSRAS